MISYEPLKKAMKKNRGPGFGLLLLNIFPSTF